MATKTLKTTFCLKLYCEYSISQSVTNNRSTITLKLIAETVGNYNVGPWEDFNGSYLGTTSMTFNGDIPNFSSKRTLTTKTMTVNHNSDGTGSATVRWKWGVNSPWGGYTNPSGSFTISLPTIARASTPTLSASAVDIGEAVTIYTNRASSSFTHTLKYSIDSASETIGTGVTTSRSWTPPTSLYQQITNATSGSCTITCETYNGSTKIGSKTVKLTLRVPSSVVPTISAVSVSELTAGLPAKFGAYVQSHSKLSVKITADGVSGSTIKTYKTTFEGSTYTTASFETPEIQGSGSLSIVTTVTDSRGRTTTKTTTINVLPYSPPAISLFNAERAAAGVPDDEGTGLYGHMSYEVSPLNNKNDASWMIQYQDTDDTSWTTLLSGSGYSAENQELTSTADTFNVDNTYSVRLTVTDYFGSAEALIDFPTAYTILDFRANGKGFSIGKVSEKDSYEVDMVTEFLQYVSFLGGTNLMEDSGWINCTYQTPFQKYNDSAPQVQVRKIGKIVHLRGVSTNTSEVSPTSETSTALVRMPAGYAPAAVESYLCQGSYGNKFLLNVNPNGFIYVSRYNDGSASQGTIPANTWLNTFATWFLE